MNQAIAFLILLLALAGACIGAAHILANQRQAADEATVAAGGQLDSECGTGPSLTEELLGYSGWGLFVLALTVLFTLIYWAGMADDPRPESHGQPRGLSITPSHPAQPTPTSRDA